MEDFLYLVPISLALGGIGLGVFMWALSNGQYDDLDGAAERIPFDDEDRPASREAGSPPAIDGAARG